MFYNEVDILFYRLSILYDVVDYFIISEATKTHAGNKKPLYYNENKEMFEKFSDKIIHLIDDQLQENVNAWYNEKHQRHYLYEGIKQLNLQSNDKIIISDVDEIPDPRLLKYLKEQKPNFNIVKIELDLYYYNLTCMYTNNKWPYTRIVSYNAYLNIYNGNTNLCREATTFNYVIPNAGWHLSYFGDSEFIRNKIEQFAHQEYNDENFKSQESIEEQIKSYKYVYKEDQHIFKKIPISENKNLPFQYEIYLKKYINNIYE